MHKFLTLIMVTIGIFAVHPYAHADDNTSSHTTYLPNNKLLGEISKLQVLNVYDAENCQKQCIADKNCKAWSFQKKNVKPLHKFPYGKAVCYFKNGPTKPVPHNCCTSGIKFTVKKLNIQNSVTKGNLKLKPIARPLKIPKQVVKPKIPEPPQPK